MSARVGAQGQQNQLASTHHSLIPYSPCPSPQVKNKDELERERKREENEEKEKKRKRKIKTSPCIIISR